MPDFTNLLDEIFVRTGEQYNELAIGARAEHNLTGNPETHGRAKARHG